MNVDGCECCACVRRCFTSLTFRYEVESFDEFVFEVLLRVRVVSGMVCVPVPFVVGEFGRFVNGCFPIVKRSVLSCCV